jgi:hypothetical protein
MCRPIDHLLPSSKTYNYTQPKSKFTGSKLWPSHLLTSIHVTRFESPHALRGENSKYSWWYHPQKVDIWVAIITITGHPHPLYCMYTLWGGHAPTSSSAQLRREETWLCCWEKKRPDYAAEKRRDLTMLLRREETWLCCWEKKRPDYAVHTICKLQQLIPHIHIHSILQVCTMNVPWSCPSALSPALICNAHVWMS